MPNLQMHTIPSATSWRRPNAWLIRLAFLLCVPLPGLHSQEAVPQVRVIRLEKREPDYRFRFRPEYRIPGQQSIALALRGGSAKGLAHLGVLQGLEEENLPVDAIVGTSAGSLVGSLYASGFSPDGIARVFKARNFGLAFDDRQRQKGWSLSEDETAHATPYRFAFVNGRIDLMPGESRSRRVRAALLPMLARASWLAGDDFNQLRVPLRVVASDLTEGKGKVFSQGPLVDVVMASMCLPGIFEPVEIEGHQYVDGGPFENLPVQASRREFPGLAQVGVAIGRPWDHARKTSLPKLLDASLDLSMAQTEAISAASADLIIRPWTGSANEFDFYHQVDALALEGRKAFEAQRPALEDLIYGKEARLPAASGLALDASGVPGTQAWLSSLVPSMGTLSYDDLYRILRRAHRDLPVSEAEILLLGSPEHPAVLRLRPAQIITRLELDLPEGWPSEARAKIEQALVQDFDLAPSQPFHEGAWSRAIERILIEGVLNQIPVLDLQGSGILPDGTLRLRLREPSLGHVRSQDPALQASFDRMLSPLQGDPIRTDQVEGQLVGASSRLGLSRVRPNLQKDGEALSLLLESQSAPSVELAPHVAYETTWGPHLALDATFLNFMGTGSRILLHGATNQRQNQVLGEVMGTLRSFPRIEWGLGGSTGKHWFGDESYTPIGKLTRSQFWVRAQTHFAQDDRGLVQLDLGQARGFLGTSGDESPNHRADYARLALEWDSLDAHTIPSSGTLIRAAVTDAFKADTGPTYTLGYARLRRLWAGREETRTPGLDVDAEIGIERNAPQERWYLVGGPDSFIGSPSASFLVPNFAILRLGFPFTLTTVFGVAVQAVPRVDLARFAADYQHPGDGEHATGLGLVLRGVAGNFYVELAGGRLRARAPGDDKTIRDHHISFLIGTRPFDLWKDR